MICSKAVLSIITGYFEVFFFIPGTIVFGSTNLVLENLGYFTNASTERQDTIYSLLFAELSISMSLSKLFLGFIADRYGCWVSRNITSTACIAGLVVIIAAAPSRSYLVWIGYPLFYGLSVGFLFNLLVLFRIYPEKRALLFTVMGAAKSGSYLLYWIYAEYIDNWLYVGILCLMPLSYVRTYLLTPKSNTALSPDHKSDDGKMIVRLGLETKNDKRIMTFKDIPKPEDGASLQDTIYDENVTCCQSFKEVMGIIFKYQNCLVYGWTFVGYFRSASLIANQEAWLGWATEENDDLVSDYTLYWLYCQLAGIIVTPISGFIIDKLTGHIKFKCGIETNVASVLLTPFLMAFCSIIWMILSYLCTYKEVGAITWIISILFLLSSVWWSVTNIYLLANNHESYHGRAFGIVSIVAIISSGLMPFLTDLTEESFNGNYGTLNWLVFGVCSVSVVFPALLFWDNRHKWKPVILEPTYIDDELQ